MEVWKDIPDLDGKYQASSLGRIRNKAHWIDMPNGGKRWAKERMIKGYKTAKGYIQLHLYFQGKNVYPLAHVLIAKTFISNPENKPFIDHLNTDKADNRVSNLKWVTALENSQNEISKQKQQEYFKSIKGIPHTKEHNKHVSEARKGCILTEEHKKHLSEARQRMLKNKQQNSNI